MLLQQWHYLTPDAANVLVGSLVMLAVLRWDRPQANRLWLVAAGALAMGLKAPNVVVVVAGGAAVTSVTWLVVRAPACDDRASPGALACGAGFRAQPELRLRTA